MHGGVPTRLPRDSAHTKRSGGGDGRVLVTDAASTLTLAEASLPRGGERPPAHAGVPAARQRPLCLLGLLTRCTHASAHSPPWFVAGVACLLVHAASGILLAGAAAGGPAPHAWRVGPQLSGVPSAEARVGMVRLARASFFFARCLVHSQRRAAPRRACTPRQSLPARAPRCGSHWQGALISPATLRAGGKRAPAGAAHAAHSSAARDVLRRAHRPAVWACPAGASGRQHRHGACPVAGDGESRAAACPSSEGCGDRLPPCRCRDFTLP